ncbi:hypothetical protein E7X23_26635, partial [Bacteroides fragilis]
SPESATPNGTITPPSSLSDIELRKYCIEQTNKESVSKSGLSPESATPNGTITPPSSLSDIELRKYCIEQTNK